MGDGRLWPREQEWATIDASLDARLRGHDDENAIALFGGPGRSRLVRGDS